MYNVRMVNKLREVSTTSDDLFLILNTLIIAIIAVVIALGYFIRAGRIKTAKGSGLRQVTYWLVAVITFQIIVDSISWYMDETYAEENLRWIFTVLEFFASYVCYFVYTECVTYMAGCSRRISNLLRIYSLLGCLGLWALIYYHKLFYYDWWQFRLMDTYWLALVYPLSIMFIDSILLIEDKSIKGRDRRFMLLFGWMPTMGVIAKMVFNDNFFARIASIAILLAMYINMIVITTRESDEVERELVEMRMNTMVSQIRPHFIFNSLSSIIDLCPEKSEAQEALIQFAKYLRVNIDALSYSHPRLFNEELQHIRAYLTLEKYNYGERLQIDYDIQTDNFTLPVLSLQPLVENAVKYGFVKKKQVNVLIRTEETDNAYRIIVEDNGGGFDEAAVRLDDKRHTGIDNVKYRLKEMVDGTLEYENIEDGTRAIMTIPKAEDK